MSQFVLCDCLGLAFCTPFICLRNQKLSAQINSPKKKGKNKHDSEDVVHLQ